MIKQLRMVRISRLLYTKQKMETAGKLEMKFIFVLHTKRTTDSCEKSCHLLIYTLQYYQIQLYMDLLYIQVTRNYCQLPTSHNV